MIATARQTAETVDLVRLQRKLQVVNADGEASKGASARPSAGSATPPEELGSIEAVLASAIARARDLSAQASLEGTVTILFSDIEDSSSLYEKLGDLRAHDVIRVHNEIFRQQIAAHRGVEVKALGDSFMVAFSSARRGPVRDRDAAFVRGLLRGPTLNCQSGSAWACMSARRSTSRPTTSERP